MLSLTSLFVIARRFRSARGFHIIPEQFSVWASVVKYFVTVRLEEMVNSVYVVLGLRFYMREEHEIRHLPEATAG
jgi:hypothetical protein